MIASIRVFGFLLLASGFLSCANRYKQDRFENFVELSRAYEENKDFSILALDRESDFLFLAIHGGALEPGTEAMASDMANQNHSLYIFTSLQTYFNKDLHVTSSKYDERRLREIAKKSKTCVSFHGFKSEKEKTCLGGSEKYVNRAKIIFGDALHVTLDSDKECKGLLGIDKRNVIYQCKEGGIQFELSRPLRIKYQNDIAYRQSVEKLFKIFLAQISEL